MQLSKTYVVALAVGLAGWPACETPAPTSCPDHDTAAETADTFAPSTDTVGEGVDSDAGEDADGEAFDGLSGESCGEGLPDCPEARPECEPVHHVCVECDVRWGSRPAGGCGEDAYCGEDWRCHPATPCGIDLDCKGSAEGPHCNSALHRCAPCGTDWHCGDSERCSGGECVPATLCDAGCAAPTPVCDYTTGRCVECLFSWTWSSSCAGARPSRCIDRQCVAPTLPGEMGCADDGDCEAAGVPCDSETGSCDPCESDEDCPQRRFCDVDTGRCERDVCTTNLRHCAAPCVVPYVTAPSAYCDTKGFHGEDAVGVVQRCEDNGSGWRFASGCEAPDRCVPESGDCRAWHDCDTGEAYCAGYLDHLVCSEEWTLTRERCPEPRVCGADGSCVVP